MDNQRVTNRLVKDALLHCKRRPFTHQKMPFCNAKGHLLLPQRAHIKNRKGFFYYILSRYSHLENIKNRHVKLHTKHINGKIFCRSLKSYGQHFLQFLYAVYRSACHTLGQ